MTSIAEWRCKEDHPARLIFHEQRVNTFDVRSWASVSDAFDAQKVVEELIEYATGENLSDNKAPSALSRCLEDMVRGKKILVVLDDV